MKRSVVEQFFGCYSHEIGRMVILTCFDRLPDFKRIYKDELEETFSGYYRGLTLNISGKRISIIHSGSGDSRVGDAVLALRDSPCRGLIYSGTAGGLCDTMSAGDILVPPDAIIGEGFSQYYKKHMFTCPIRQVSSASSCLIVAAKTFFSGLRQWKRRIHFSRIFTIDSIFAETPKQLAEIEGQGAEAIDMETSAFFTAATQICVPSVAIHYITDFPKKETDPRTYEQECLRAYLVMPRLLVNFVCSEYV